MVLQYCFGREMHVATVLDHSHGLACLVCTSVLRITSYKQFPGKPAAEVSEKNKLTYRSGPVLSTMRVPRVPQSDA